MTKNKFSVESIGKKIANQIDALLDFADGVRSDKLSCKEDVELVLKILVPSKDWYDKTINQQGNLIGLVRELSEDDKAYIYKLKVGELELSKKGGRKG